MAAQHLNLQIIGLRRPSHADQQRAGHADAEALQLRVDPSTTVEQLAQMIEADGFERPLGFFDGDRVLKWTDSARRTAVVAEGPAGCGPGELRMPSRGMTFLEFFNSTVDAAEGGGDRRPWTQVQSENGIIKFDCGFELSFQRTLRIPEDGKTHSLPPGLGRFPIYRVHDYREKVPEEWAKRGGLFIPMYQREAMWMSFGGIGALSGPSVAVKVGVGKVNAISGAPWNGDLCSNPQNYVVCPKQLWLDGINAGEGVIRQFVAMPLGQGYTVEGQVTGEEVYGGIQIEVVPLMRSDVDISGPSGPIENLLKTAEEVGLEIGSKIKLKSPCFGTAPLSLRESCTLDCNPRSSASAIAKTCQWRTFRAAYGAQIFVKTLSGKIIDIRLPLSSTVMELQEFIQSAEGIPPDQQLMIFYKDRRLQYSHSLADCGVHDGCELCLAVRLVGGYSPDSRSVQLGMGAGGKMHQKIYPDTKGARWWNVTKAERIFVCVLNSSHFRRITGGEPPETPVSVAAYTSTGLPWFDLYDDDMGDVASPAAMAEVRPVAALDMEKGAIDEEGECPVCMVNQVNSALLPCGHGVCSECVRALHAASSRGKGGAACPLCRQTIAGSECSSAVYGEADRVMTEHPKTVICLHRNWA